MKINTIIIVILVLLACHTLQAPIIGSNSAVTRQGLATFPYTDATNTMLGFAAFDAGFTLDRSTTAVSYDDYFPIGGVVTLNGGTLNLNRDLVWHKGITLQTVGTINGNNYSMLFTSTATLTLPASAILGNVPFIAEQNFGSAVGIARWAADGASIAAASTSSATYKIYSFNGTSLTQTTTGTMPTNVLSLDWHPSQLFLAVGSLKSTGGNNEVQILSYNSGTGVLTFIAGQNGHNDENAVAWAPNGTYLATVESTGTSKVAVYSFVNPTLTALTSLGYSPNRTPSNNALAWDSSSRYFATGVVTDGTNPELILFNFNALASTITFTLQSVVIGATVNTLDWSPTGSFIAVGLASGSETLRVYEHVVQNGTLPEATSARVGESVAVKSVSWSPDGNRLLVARAVGTGTEFRVYSFNKTAKTLSLVSELDSTVNFNSADVSPVGGTYYLTGDSSNKVSVFGSTTGTSAGFVLNNIKVTFNGDVILTNTLWIQGTVDIDSTGHNMFLGTAGSIVLSSGASLLLENMEVKNIAGNNVACIDSLGTLSLSNVLMQQDANYSFTKGHLEIFGDVVVTATNIINGAVFAYTTDQVSTISSNSTLFFDSGMTFSYAPATSSKNLLTFADSSASLHLFETTLYLTTTGLQLTRGNLVIEGECPIVSNAVALNQGLLFGDGISSNNNVGLNIFPESGFDIRSGFVVNQNI